MNSRDIVNQRFFEKIKTDNIGHQNLKDLGYKSNNHRPFIPLMKSLGFLSSDGSPTQRYHEYRNHSKSREIMGQAIKEAYSDIFLIKSNPTDKDKDLVQGKFKSYHNTSDNVAKLHTNTFYALLDIADLNHNVKPKVVVEQKEKQSPQTENKPQDTPLQKTLSASKVGLHYNIQIHLPATKDVEVYNAIFKSLKDHLID
ncbi:DUF5343 domain-containing protein [Leeuwenhoekiella aequorea]|uniref:DUF5343 domain-containing protein n=1 Tax=Leeuwenhoekiella aequorea TaxID=283736 RepID=UPI00352E82E1|tara:strand:+ start:308 stop:904 length:597 start_codon:yes stop_codon:yes gene_type:complete